MKLIKYQLSLLVYWMIVVDANILFCISFSLRSQNFFMIKPGQIIAFLGITLTQINNLQILIWISKLH